LSSGQKEMIATLFLIWKNTKKQPSIVLIDEPELHLNAEWHGDFVRQLYKLAPQNQYILATHSEEIFRSVDERHRSVLIPDEDG
jgi:predicted ATP-dependent endonuclease of OLD family